jgi:hypothetical protein
MTAVELATCHLPEDVASPVQMTGYVVAFMAFYERRFDVSSHLFLRSLLQYYGLELHHLAPLGILRIVTFVMLCEAYMGIDTASTCGTTSFTFGSRRVQTRKWRFWEAWSSTSRPGMTSQKPPCTRILKRVAEYMVLF